MREKKALLCHFTAALCIPAAAALGTLAFAVPASAAPSATARQWHSRRRCHLRPV
jgi:hypothetical protein